MTADRWVGIAQDGACIGITVHSSVPGSLGDHWPSLGLTRSTPPEGADAPQVADELVVDAADRWDQVEADLALFTAEHLTDHVAVHAGVVLWRDEAIVLPGSSFAGKSTLCLALADLGATVLSDEYALVDASTGLVTGYPRTIRGRSADGRVVQLQTAVPPSTPVPVSLVAMLRYHPGGQTPWERLSEMDAVLSLVANTVCAQRRPGPTMDAALALGRTAPALWGRRSDAQVAARQILSIASQRWSLAHPRLRSTA